MDRNTCPVASDSTDVTSLSARRAWIEIPCMCSMAPAISVALRKESVDRNGPADYCDAGHAEVALRKESVDRNTMGATIVYAIV